MSEDIEHSDDVTVPERLKDLVRLREALKSWMMEAPLDRKAALIAQFRAVLVEIDDLAPPVKAKEGFDEVKARRDARRSRSSAYKGRSENSG